MNMQNIRDADAEGNRWRTAPHNIEVEQAVLGAMLLNADAVSAAMDIVSSRQFYEPLHAEIFEAIGLQSSQGRVTTPVTLAPLFDGREVTPYVTVAQYLGRLAASATTTRNAADYARIVRDLATRRDLIALGEDLVNAAYDSPIDLPPEEQIGDAEQRLYDLAERGKFGQGSVSFAEAVNEAVLRASDAYQRGNSIIGVSSGLTDLDARLGGFQKGELTILAGRPSMGKSALATNIAFDAAMRGLPVDFYSLEMTAEQLATRIVADRVAIGSDKLRRGQISEDQFRALVAACKAVQGAPLHIDQTGALSIGQMAARARRNKRKHGTGLIVVDYLQLMQATRPSNNRVQDVTEITTGLKALAKDLDVPVIALSQLSRQVESRNDKRPMLSDLRESGSIEQDADVVMFVYREEYYVERERPDIGDVDAFADWNAKLLACRGLGEIIIGKSRHSEVGMVKVAWDGARTRFSDLGRMA